MSEVDIKLIEAVVTVKADDKVTREIQQVVAERLRYRAAIREAVALLESGRANMARDILRKECACP